MRLALLAHKIGQELRLRRRGIHRHMHVFSHTSTEERLALHQLARSLPDGARVLEIGSHIGSSALFLGAALKDKGGRLFCCDTWHNETMPDGEQDTYATFAKNTSEYADIITPLRKRSDAVSFEDVGLPLDMVFIDGDHSEEGVRSDFRLVEGWIKKGGVIAFHDASPIFPGVNKVVGDALASGSWQIVGLYGCLAVIVKVEDNRNAA